MNSLDFYYNISYKSAVDFLKTLTDKEIKQLLDEYSEESIENLADVIADNKLYELGYVGDKYENLSNVGEENYMNTEISTIASFLNDLDEDTLQDLYDKYDAITTDDLAIAITDEELKLLGFGKNVSVGVEEAVSNVSDMGIFESNCFTVNEDLDFFEDIPSDINFAVIDAENYVFAVKDDIDYNRLVASFDPLLVEWCEKLDYSGDTVEDSGVYFQVVPIEYSVSEEVVINDELNTEIFTDNTIREDVLTTLNNYVKSLLDYLNNKGIELDIQDVLLVGSNAGYLYTPESDIDLHLISSVPLDVDVFGMLRDELYEFIAEQPLMIGNHVVEFNIEDGYNMSSYDGRKYSIISNEWVNDSDKLEVYTKEDIESVAGYEDVVNDYVEQIDDIVSHDEYEDAIALKIELRQNRSTDLANLGALSMGNVVYKELRSNGAYDKLNQYIKSKEITVNEDVSVKEPSNKAKDFFAKKAEADL